jgi:hypothetical protein
VFDEFATLENSCFVPSVSGDDLVNAVPPKRKNQVASAMSSNKFLPMTRASSQKASSSDIPSHQGLPSLLGSLSEQGLASCLNGIPPRGDSPKCRLPSKASEVPIV